MMPIGTIYYNIKLKLRFYLKQISEIDELEMFGKIRKKQCLITIL